MDVSENYGAYKKWRKRGGSVDQLKNIICLYQFGGKIKGRKLLWILSPQGRIPIVVVPETSLKYLEKKIIPGLVNPKREKRKIKRLGALQCENFYNSVKDGDNIWYILV